MLRIEFRNVMPPDIFGPGPSMTWAEPVNAAVVGSGQAQVDPAGGIRRRRSHPSEGGNARGGSPSVTRPGVQFSPLVPGTGRAEGHS